MRFTSPVERWPGWIETGDYLRFPQLLAWEESLSKTKTTDTEVPLGELYQSLLPTAISFVKKWHIVGLNVDVEGNPLNDEKGQPITVDYCNFPASGRLVSWLVKSISELYSATNSTDPN